MQRCSQTALKTIRVPMFGDSQFCRYYFLKKYSASFIFLKIVLTNPFEVKF